jgi:hypothetical protein
MIRMRCFPVFSLCHPERSLRSEGSRASTRASIAGAGHQSVRRDSSPSASLRASAQSQRLPLRMTQKTTRAQICGGSPEPSPTDRDAAGLLSRKITGEVFGARGNRARNSRE